MVARTSFASAGWAKRGGDADIKAKSSLMAWEAASDMRSPFSHKSFHTMQMNDKKSYIQILTMQRLHQLRQTDYPQEKQGMLWVWPQSGADAFLRSTNKQPVVMDTYEDPILPVSSPEYDYFEAAANWSLVLENAMDPTHAASLHEGAMGKRKDMVSPSPHHSCLPSSHPCMC